MSRTQPFLSVLVGLLLSLSVQVQSKNLKSEKWLRSKRNGIKDSSYHWPDGVIPYDIDINSFGTIVKLKVIQIK